jgi:signal transduction histidine kinase
VERTIESLLEEDDKLSILYVEDNEFVRESTVDLLSLYFNHIDTAENGEEGLKAYDAYYETHGEHYDIVLTDINMPKMNGIKMIEHIRKRHERQNIIVISAYDDSENLIKLIDLEVNKFVPKPIDIERFEKVFADTIEIIHHRRRIHEMNERLKQAKELAEQAAETKSRFLANMSHEIRTPLNAIIGFISLLREIEDDPKKIKYLDVIKNASDSLLQIINDILDFSKIESGKLSIEPTIFNPYDDLIDIAELFQAKAAEKHIVFKVKYNKNMPTRLKSDLLRIRQIYSNLLSNAIKFTPEGKAVKSVIWYKDGMLHIRVKDYGIGISEEKQREIFQPFTQADNSTARLYGGTGLGLAICLELAKLLGGRLKLQSQEGKGSVFTLSVPVELDNEHTNQSTKEENTPTTSVNLNGHILVVEDYEANRMYVGVILENAGLTYETANDGIEAIEKFRNGKFDAILMDENMPNMGGTEATQHILEIERKEGREHTPIITVTANALHGDQERFLRAGFDDYLTKPIEPNHLLKTLARHMKKKGHDDI